MPSALARILRRNPTEAEARLWSRLRKRQPDGRKFRRQAPLGPYVVDFACLSERLVVEVDGGQHAWKARQDAARTAWLEANDFRVLRFWNDEVLGNLEAVLETIRQNLPPTPTLPRKGEGGDLSPFDSAAQCAFIAGPLPPSEETSGKRERA